MDDLTIGNKENKETTKIPKYYQVLSIQYSESKYSFIWIYGSFYIHIYAYEGYSSILFGFYFDSILFIDVRRRLLVFPNDTNNSFVNPSKRHPVSFNNANVYFSLECELTNTKLPWKRQKFTNRRIKFYKKIAKTNCLKRNIICKI